MIRGRWPGRRGYPGTGPAARAALVAGALVERRVCSTHVGRRARGRSSGHLSVGGCYRVTPSGYCVVERGVKDGKRTGCYPITPRRPFSVSFSGLWSRGVGAEALAWRWVAARRSPRPGSTTLRWASTTFTRPTLARATLAPNRLARWSAMDIQSNVGTRFDATDHRPATTRLQSQERPVSTAFSAQERGPCRPVRCWSHG